MHTINTVSADDLKDGDQVEFLFRGTVKDGYVCLGEGMDAISLQTFVLKRAEYIKVVGTAPPPAPLPDPMAHHSVKGWQARQPNS